MTRILEGCRRSAIVAAAVLVLVAAQAPAQLLDRAALDALLESAESPADHRKLAEHFDAQAKELRRQPDEHKAIGAKYERKGLPPKSAAAWRQMNHHCASLVKAFASAAKESTDLAAMHRSMAEQAR